VCVRARFTNYIVYVLLYRDDAGAALYIYILI